MIRGLKELLRFIWADFVSDYQFLKRFFLGKSKPRKIDWGKEVKEIRWLQIFKDYWLWYLIVVFAFVCGYLYAGWALQDKCNDFIFNVLLPDNPTLDLGVIFNFSN